MAFRGGPRRRDTARQARGATSKVPQSSGTQATAGTGMLSKVGQMANNQRSKDVATGSPSRGGIMQQAKSAISAQKASVAPQRAVGTVAKQPRARNTATQRGSGMVRAQKGGTSRPMPAQRATTGFMGRGATVGRGATAVDGGGKVHIDAHVTGKAKAEWRAGSRIHAKRTGKTKA